MRIDIADLLSDLHHSIDLVAADLSRDRPDLANALRAQAASIPRPDDLRPRRSPRTPRAAATELRPLLYRALDEGVVDADKFDRLMLQQNRALRAVRGRR
jgi:hypothetical protein